MELRLEDTNLQLTANIVDIFQVTLILLYY